MLRTREPSPPVLYAALGSLAPSLGGELWHWVIGVLAVAVILGAGAAIWCASAISRGITRYEDEN